jgi:hypothetical protein
MHNFQKAHEKIARTHWRMFPDGLKPAFYGYIDL